MIIQAEDLQYHYPSIHCCFAMAVQAGEIIAITGPNGSGKSTLLNLLAGFIPPLQGRLYLASHEHTHTIPYQRPLSLLFQKDNLFPHLTIIQNLGLALHPGLRLTHYQQQEVLAMASLLQLQPFLHQRPAQLSGGQQQWVALARCLLRQQPILLLDEPFAALDPQRREELLQLLKKRHSEQSLTILIVSHQLTEVASIAQRSWVIVNGKIIYDGATQALLTASPTLNH